MEEEKKSNEYSSFSLLLKINSLIAQFFENDTQISEDDLMFVMTFKQLYKFHDSNTLLNQIEEFLYNKLEREENKQRKRTFTETQHELSSSFLC